MSLNKTTIRIRNNTPLNKTVRQRKRNMSFNQFSEPNETTPDYLSDVKKIMNQAKQTSDTINIQFRKISEKPSVQVIYITSQQLQKKLHQMNTRIDLTKYYVLVQVRKDALNGLATKKENVTDQIVRKNYKTIYKQYLKDQKKQPSIQILNNPLVSLYQFYDDQQRDWKQSLKNRKLIARQKIKQNHQKGNQQQQKKKQQEKQKQQQGKITELHQSMNQNQRYQKIFEDVALQNGFFEPVQTDMPKAQKIIIDRFQNKFYRCRQKKFQHAIDRLASVETNEQSQILNQQSFSNSPQKKKKLKLTVPESCQRVFNTQNKLLSQNLSKGLSEDHRKKLIVQFNKTILDMKINQPSSNTSKVFRQKSYSQQKKSNNI